MKFILFIFLFSPIVFATSTSSSGNMISETMTISNPACVITQANGNASNLPVLAPNVIPTPLDYFELVVETQKGHFPYILRASSISITGLENYQSDEVVLNQLMQNGSEMPVGLVAERLESTNAFDTDFSAKLFFRKRQDTSQYLPHRVKVETTVTIECR